MPSSPIKIFIVEDEPLFRHALELVITAEEDMEIVGIAENGLHSIDPIKATNPDIILLDIRMPKMDGITCIKKIREFNRDVIILILTTFNEEEYIVEGLAHGANGYLLKGIEFKKLVQTIRESYNGLNVMPTAVALKLANYLKSHKSYINQNSKILSEYIQNTFSKREQQVIKLLMKRLSNREIAQELFVSEGTVKNYLTIIYEKLQVKNRLEAIETLKAVE